MSIKGKDKIYCIHRILTGNYDSYCQPTYDLKEELLENVLIAPTGATQNITLFQIRQDTDLTLYIPTKYSNTLQNTDSFRTLSGEKYEINAPIQIWSLPKGFKLGTKIIVELKKLEG